MPLSRFAAGILVSVLGLGLAVGDTSPARALSETDMSLMSSSEPAMAGAPVTFTARVTTAAGGPPTGTVIFRADGSNQATATLFPRDGGKAISVGSEHACALTSTRGVVCWGKNGNGQLGDNSLEARSTPVDVIGLSSGVVAVGAGFEHSCALTDAGAVKCWGLNNRGQLGTGDRIDSLVPMPVSGLSSGVSAITVGQFHSCALVSGGVWCWGLDGGRLGNTAVVDRVTPVLMTGLESGVVRISAGWAHSCAILATGAAKCWGSNFNGQLGDGGDVGPRTATDVAGLASGVASIGAGDYHTCALTDAGGVK